MSRKWCLIDWGGKGAGPFTSGTEIFFLSFCNLFFKPLSMTWILKWPVPDFWCWRMILHGFDLLILKTEGDPSWTEKCFLNLPTFSFPLSIVHAVIVCCNLYFNSSQLEFLPMNWHYKRIVMAVFTFVLILTFW